MTVAPGPNQQIVPVYCTNGECPEAVRSGGRRRQLLTKATVGSTMELQCRKCGERRWRTARES